MNARLAVTGVVALCVLAGCGSETVSAQDAAPEPEPTSAPTSSPTPSASLRASKFPDNLRASCPGGIERGPIVDTRPTPGKRPTTPATPEAALERYLARGSFGNEETSLHRVANYERHDIVTPEPEVDLANYARFVGFRPDGTVFSVLRFDRSATGAWGLDHQSGCVVDVTAQAKAARLAARP